jgi:hypothetical protein
MGITAENEDDKTLDAEIIDENIEGEPPEVVDNEAEEVEIVVSGEEPSPDEDGKKQGLGRRARRLLEKNKQLNDESETVKAQNRLLQMQLEQLSGKKVAKLDKPPTLASCGYDEDEYQKAMVDYLSTSSRTVFSDELKKLQEQSQQQSVQHSRREALESHYKRADDLKVKDYDDAETAALEVLGRDAVEDIAATIDESERVLYYLGKNPAKAQEIKHLLDTNPVKATYAIGKLAAGLEIRPKTKPNPKQPDTPLEGGGSPSAASSWEKRLELAREKAGKTGDMSPVIELKRQARAEGVNL